MLEYLPSWLVEGEADLAPTPKVADDRTWRNPIGLLLLFYQPTEGLAAELSHIIRER
jgi:hypothetical protein